MFTARHYQAIADVLREQRGTITTNGHRQMHTRITRALADMLATDDPRFDPGIFTELSGIPQTSQKQ